jgi:hypothetical protein
LMSRKTSIVKAVTALDLHRDFVANGVVDVERVAADGTIFFWEIRGCCDGGGVMFGFEVWADWLNADVGELTQVDLVVVVGIELVIRSAPCPEWDKLSVRVEEVI